MTVVVGIGRNRGLRTRGLPSYTLLVAVRRVAAVAAAAPAAAVAAAPLPAADISPLHRLSLARAQFADVSHQLRIFSNERTQSDVISGVGPQRT